MPPTIKVGEVSANAGESAYGAATSVELRDGTKVNLPVIVANGKQDGPRVVIVGGTHPTELIGVAAVQILMRKIDSRMLKGSVIAFPMANPLGMQFAQYISPHDGVNMYYAYPGSSDGSVTLRLANFIWENAIKGADFVMDIHENQVPCLSFCFVDEPKTQEIGKKAMDVAQALGITIIKAGKASFPLPGASSSSLSLAAVCMKEGIPALTPEFEGGPEVWAFNERQHHVAVAVKALTNALKKLGMMEGKIEPQTGIKVLRGNFEAYGIVKSNKAGYVDRLVEPGVKLSKGTPIARIVNAFGEEVEKVAMPVDGYIWGWPLSGGSGGRHLSVHQGGNVAYVFREV